MKLNFDPKNEYAGYFRNSTLDQEHSLDGQNYELENFATAKGIQINHRYFDSGKTGTNMKRKGLQQMLKDAKNKKFNILLVYRVDRLARNTEEFFFMMKIFRENGIRVYSVQEDLVYSNEDLLMCFMKSYEATNYSIKLREDSLRGVKQAIRDGRHAGGLPSYGFDVDPSTKKYVQNHAEAKIVNEIFERFVAGNSMKLIAKTLNERGIRNKKGNPWRVSNISLILHSPKYLGDLVWKRTTNKDEFGNSKRNIKSPDSEIITIKGACPKIIEDDLYNQAQAILKDSYKKAGQYKAKRTYLLSGSHKLTCRECEGELSGMSRATAGRNKTPWISYRCNNKKAKKCSIKEIPAIKLEKAVVRGVLPLIFNKHRLNKIKKMINAAFAEDSGINAKKDDLRQSLDKCVKRREKFLDAIGNGINLDGLKQRIQDSDAAISKLQNEIDALSNQKIVTKKSIKRISKRLMKLDSDQHIRNLKLFLPSIVDQIIVDNNNVEIWVTVDVGKKTCKELNVKKIKKGAG